MSSAERSRRSLAIDDREPAGKPVDLCRKVSVKLTLHDPDKDVEVHRKSGLMGLRRHKLLRITKEAIEQGALLSYEDIAFILTSSTATIKRDMATMRRAGLTIPTRGLARRLRPGLATRYGPRHHPSEGSLRDKTQILELHLGGYQFSHIEKRTHHSETAVKRYIQDFSNRLIREYIQLYQHHEKERNPRLKAILDSSKKTSLKKPGGGGIMTNGNLKFSPGIKLGTHEFLVNKRHKDHAPDRSA